MSNLNDIGTVWLVWPEEAADQIPTACFTDYNIAKQLTYYLGSFQEPTEINAGATSLEIDKYLPQMVQMKYPFDVTMYRDGSLFEANDAGIMGEPEVSYSFVLDDETNILLNGEPMGIGGVFWADHQSEAIELADQFRSEMIKKGKL